jgi:hypothetical protein
MPALCGSWKIGLPASCQGRPPVAASVQNMNHPGETLPHSLVLPLVTDFGGPHTR